MENQDQPAGIFNLEVDNTSRLHIKTIAAWAIIIVVSSLLGYVISFIDYFKKRNQFEGLLSEDDGSLSGYLVKFGKGGNLGGIIISLIIGLLLCYFLYQFATKAKKGIENISQQDLNEGLVNLKNYFVTIGIIAVIVLALMVFAMFIAFTF
jgi:small-conductance mechanosensitive channel